MKLKSSLFPFGIIRNKIRYSDPEKTILDIMYKWKYNGIPKEKIVSDISEWSKNLSKPKIKEYSKNYPKTIQDITREMVR